MGEYLEYLLPGCTRACCPIWPPDVFALAASVLRHTGLYTRLVEVVPTLGSPPVDPATWPREARGVAKAWRDALAQAPIANGDLGDVDMPGPLLRDWEAVVSGADLPVYAARKATDQAAVAALVRALLRLSLIADEASAGVGIRLHQPDAVIKYGDARLAESGGRSLTWRVLLEKARVLPKQHTPQRGMTLRSLTHHLALFTADEVEAIWIPASSLRKEQRSRLDVFNILTLPWPLEMSVRDFAPADGTASVPALPTRFRYFSVGPHRRAPEPFRAYLQARLAAARATVGDVDAVILPEMSLTGPELHVAQKVAVDQGLLLITGAALGPEDRDEYNGAANVAVIDPSGLLGAGDTNGLAARFQRKHHRWCLDREQIVQYGLGGVLPASHDCWELTDIGAREVHFFTLDSWLSFCVLVCEDLARQDPLADAIRSVGPNLVVALLMDGPQLSGRWPSRYASVLAEDPGSSVLTLTSLGMAQLSRPREPGKTSRSRVIASWRDIQYGERELELDEGHTAGVLSLVCRQFEEYSADGRGDGSTAFFPVFAGWRSLK